MKREWTLAAYSYSHFAVDFACFYMLFRGIKDTFSLSETALFFLLYNVIAFGLQPLIGYLCDKHTKVPISLIGCALTASGVCLLHIPWACIALCGFGNACFHIGGGIDSLVDTNGRMSRSGIFVSTGALGIALGSLSAGFTILLPLLLLGVAAALLVFAVKRPATYSSGIDIASSVSFSAVLILALFSVIVRSFGGGIIPSAWKTGGGMIFLAALASALGKALGGILGDRLGARTVGVGALILSVPLLLFGKDISAVSLAGILLFNMTMPITLCAVVSKLPNNPGLSFGLTTLALLIGVIPAFFFKLSDAYVKITLALLIAAAAMCVHLVTKNHGGRNETRQTV